MKKIWEIIKLLIESLFGDKRELKKFLEGELPSKKK